MLMETFETIARIKELTDIALSVELNTVTEIKSLSCNKFFYP